MFLLEVIGQIIILVSEGSFGGAENQVVDDADVVMTLRVIVYEYE